MLFRLYLALFSLIALVAAAPVPIMDSPGLDARDSSGNRDWRRDNKGNRDWKKRDSSGNRDWRRDSSGNRDWRRDSSGNRDW
ncbi:hypothetical protein FB45DRAFT_915808 [Roridomyces roridus]|uniref:Uncharacterized protein n=1 Tax=Roridomyces roridus TaxID=1738132 RepID=A0AAD7FP17_9AGAR|nr:hypothetical protein FB45DRAFT_915808 [Roridomyces roridus]